MFWGPYFIKRSPSGLSSAQKPYRPYSTFLTLFGLHLTFIVLFDLIRPFGFIWPSSTFLTLFDLLASFDLHRPFWPYSTLFDLIWHYSTLFGFIWPLSTFFTLFDIFRSFFRYGSTSECLVQSAMMILREKDKMPGSGGVFTPGYAFYNTSLVDKLNANQVTFEVKVVDVWKAFYIPHSLQGGNFTFQWRRDFQFNWDIKYNSHL